MRLVEDIKADISVPTDVWVIDSGHELDFGCDTGVLLWNGHLEAEGPAFIRRVGRSFEHGIPSEGVTVDVFAVWAKVETHLEELFFDLFQFLQSK